MLVTARRRVARLGGRVWTRAWMQLARDRGPGRLATRLASLGAGPTTTRGRLATLTPRGYVSPSARVEREGVRRGAHCLIGDRAELWRQPGGGPIELADEAWIHSDVHMVTESGGTITIGSRSSVHRQSVLVAAVGSIRVGADVLIAPQCALYPYDHGRSGPGPIRSQPLVSRGDIVVGDGAWLGFGVVVLAGVTIGPGAVVGAGSVVTHDVPEGAVVAGNPARAVRPRHLAAA
jgi:acetyltransferase-like isoleucine patch superfamily enzyme